MINVFTIISTISFEIHTETTNPTNPPNKALNPPVVSSPFNKLLKWPFNPLTLLFPIKSSNAPAKNIHTIENIYNAKHKSHTVFIFK